MKYRAHKLFGDAYTNNSKT